MAKGCGRVDAERRQPIFNKSKGQGRNFQTRRDRPRRVELLPDIYPSRFSEQRIRIVRMLRQWEKTPRKYRRSDGYAVSTLMGQIERRAIRPSYLPELTTLKQRRGFLLALVVLSCCVRGARAVRGSRNEWGLLLGCCGKTAWSDLEWCVEEDWLVKLPQFKKHRSHGRAGEVLDHRQLENWYQPGRKLTAAWTRFRDEQRESDQRFRRAGLPAISQASIVASAPPESPDGKNYRPSAFSLQRLKPIPSTDSNLSTGSQTTAPAAVFDGDKVSPAATVGLGGPPPAAARIGAVSDGERATSGGRKAANQEAWFGCSPSVQDSRRRDESKTTEHLAMLSSAAVDVSHARDLVRMYRVDASMAESALTLARCLEHSLRSGR